MTAVLAALGIASLLWWAKEPAHRQEPSRAKVETAVPGAVGTTGTIDRTRTPALSERPVPYGIAYGLLLYGIMNYIVVPLSRAGPSNKDPLWVAMSIAVHLLLIGLPIALYARRAILVDSRSPAPASV